VKHRGIAWLVRIHQLSLPGTAAIIRAVDTRPQLLVGRAGQMDGLSADEGLRSPHRRRSCCLTREHRLPPDATRLRIGLGHDLHRLEAGRRLVIGGVPIEHDRGPFGHSDGDVLLHAVTDALLGALGLGDIGQWFPDTDPQWKDADSAEFVSQAVAAVREHGWSIANVDCTVFAERPKLAPHNAAIRQRLSGLLGISADAVNVKAKTGERVDAIGRQEAIGADAIVLLVRES
jgi:2-C-methyl-D-erythritol 2,4-cyclodiphosphate synthase